RSNGTRTGDVETFVAWVVPDLVTASDLRDDVEHMTRQRTQDDRLAARRHQEVLEWGEGDACGARARCARECQAVEGVRFVNHHADRIDTSDHRAAACGSRHGDPESVDFAIP